MRQPRRPVPKPVHGVVAREDGVAVRHEVRVVAHDGRAPAVKRQDGDEVVRLQGRETHVVLHTLLREPVPEVRFPEERHVVTTPHMPRLKTDGSSHPRHSVDDLLPPPRQHRRIGLGMQAVNHNGIDPATPRAQEHMQLRPQDPPLAEQKHGALLVGRHAVEDDVDETVAVDHVRLVHRGHPGVRMPPAHITQESLATHAGTAPL